jgi:hypothetical protein
MFYGGRSDCRLAASLRATAPCSKVDTGLTHLNVGHPLRIGHSLQALARHQGVGLTSCLSGHLAWITGTGHGLLPLSQGLPMPRHTRIEFPGTVHHLSVRIRPDRPRACRTARWALAQVRRHRPAGIHAELGHGCQGQKASLNPLSGACSRRHRCLVTKPASGWRRWLR